MIIPPNCPECTRQTKIFKNITVDNTIQYYFYCPDCRRRPYPGVCIKHTALVGIDLSTIPTIENYASQYGEKCAVCQVQGAQYHHIAPRYIFGDLADIFPGIYLCLPHHRQWHDTVDAHYGKPERKSYD